jgi:hypothetical protein
MTRLRKPKVEHMIPAAMIRDPAGPTTTPMVSAAGAVLAASPPAPSVRR